MKQNTELSISSWFGYELSFEERIKLIKGAGFQSVMIWWGEEYWNNNKTKKLIPEIIRKDDLKIDNIHFSFAGINSLWEDSIEGEELLNNYFLQIEDCKKFVIPTAVMHITSRNTPSYGQLGLKRFKQLAEKAEKEDVTIALENVFTPEYLDYLLVNINSDKLKFCYDSGHENCFTKGIDFLEKYGGRLAALHLHDNDGSGDQHMLPFSASVNWERIMKKLKKVNYKGSLALEIDAKYSHVLNKYNAKSFLAEAKNRANKLLNIL